MHGIIRFYQSIHIVNSIPMKYCIDIKDHPLGVIVYGGKYKCRYVDLKLPRLNDLKSD